jgi:hypothetical protein
MVSMVSTNAGQFVAIVTGANLVSQIASYRYVLSFMVGQNLYLPPYSGGMIMSNGMKYAGSVALFEEKRDVCSILVRTYK